MEQTDGEYYTCLVQMPQVGRPSFGTAQSLELFEILASTGAGASACSNGASEHGQH